MRTSKKSKTDNKSIIKTEHDGKICDKATGTSKRCIETTKTTSRDNLTKSHADEFGWARIDTLICFLVTALSLITRLHDIQEPAHVCWDETHFGKMATWYLNRTFFFDVHPPFGKMMIALSGYLTGYDGQFAFDKPGDPYEHWTQYVGMRIFCALLGASIPVFVYYATKAMTESNFSALMAAILVLFDNGLITLTRYILLDPPLLFFISASILGMAKVSFSIASRHSDTQNSKDFNLIWLFWLLWTGISIACAFSVKFVGLFVVVLVGFRTVYDLWLILGDISRPMMCFIKHFLIRAICLIIVPISLYIIFFYIHLSQLNHSGNGDGFYSSAFQSQLVGNSLHNSSWPAHLAYGAEVTVKNNRIGGAYLHSHWHLYPEGIGARQQQVTTYSHKDSNNKWIIKRGVENQRPEDIYVRDGDLVMLEHVVTKRNLHSHFEPGPVTKRHYQVTCYGENGIGDANDIWQIQKYSSNTSASATTNITNKIVGWLNKLLSRLSNLSQRNDYENKQAKAAKEEDEEENDDRIYTVKTRFKLRHYLTNCALHSHSKQLPKWAYDQLEVTCNPILYDKNNFWNIEDNSYPQLQNISFDLYAPSFFERFIESHAVMLQGNAGLKPKEGEVTSRPWQWPINYRGQFFSASKGQKVYLLGNPIIWWANIVAIPISCVCMIGLAIHNKLAAAHGQPKTCSRKPVAVAVNGIQMTYLEAATWTFIGWLVHYVPFYFMGRILYFHHYFPAFIFSCMLTAMTYDYLIDLIARSLNINSNGATHPKLEILIALSSIVIYTFTKFLPLTYGTKASDLASELAQNDTSTEVNWKQEQQLSSLKWLDSWEF